MAGDLNWRKTEDQRIEVQTPAGGCAAVGGLILTAAGLLVTITALFRLFLGSPTGVIGLVVGILLLAAGLSMTFRERSVILDGGERRVTVVREYPLIRRVHSYPAAEFHAVTVRPHGAAAPAGSSPRIAHYTHDILLLRREGKPLHIDHVGWDHAGEAWELALAIAGLLALATPGHEGAG